MNTQEEVKRAIDTMVWLAGALDGRKLVELPTKKRIQLGGASLQMAIEHANAIIVLIDEELVGAALALIRPAFEAYHRGAWLLRAATEAQVNAAWRDNFPDAGTIDKGLAKSGMKFKRAKTDWWRTLCSYTHTGVRQLQPRLTPEGLRPSYKPIEVTFALKSAQQLALMSLIDFGGLLKDEDLQRGALEQMKKVDRAA